jgi:hypothetical protein
MTTITLQISDQDLLAEAKKLGGHKTEQETVDEALKEYIRWCKQIKAIQDFGTIDFDPEFLAEIDRKSQS